MSTNAKQTKVDQKTKEKKGKKNPPLKLRKQPMFRNFEFDIEEGVFVNLKEEIILMDGPANEMGREICGHVKNSSKVIFESMNLQLLYPSTKIFIIKAKEQTKEGLENRVYSVDSLSSLIQIPVFNL